MSESQCASVDEFIQKSQEQMSNAYAIAREHLGVAAQRRKTTYDIRVRRSSKSATGFGTGTRGGILQSHRNGKGGTQARIWWCAKSSP